MDFLDWAQVDMGETETCDQVCRLREYGPLSQIQYTEFVVHLSKAWLGLILLMIVPVERAIGNGACE